MEEEDGGDDDDVHEEENDDAFWRLGCFSGLIEPFGLS